MTMAVYQPITGGHIQADRSQVEDFKTDQFQVDDITAMLAWVGMV